ncbi:MAG: hypothetical protein A2889_06620 [Nitrospinae bacterium RIFCSPLOWO2_01_FULL_39_10]|nr:MAG: hypothetical protein A2889_06620 [Nitrospinae bacterium RIFCSPLOWO2_01_FULL_39_10]
MLSQEIKTIGSSGQISLGKEYAGQPVLIEEIEEGVWLIKTAKVIPDSEMWIHEEPTKSRIDKSIKWAGKNKPIETNLEKLIDKIR